MADNNGKDRIPMKRVTHPQFVAVYEWIRTNVEKLVGSKTTYSQAAEMVEKELGFPVSAGTISEVRDLLPGIKWESPHNREGKAVTVRELGQKVQELTEQNKSLLDLLAETQSKLTETEKRLCAVEDKTVQLMTDDAMARRLFTQLYTHLRVVPVDPRLNVTTK